MCVQSSGVNIQTPPNSGRNCIFPWRMDTPIWSRPAGAISTKAVTLKPLWKIIFGNSALHPAGGLDDDPPVILGRPGGKILQTAAMGRAGPAPAIISAPVGGAHLPHRRFKFQCGDVQHSRMIETAACGKLQKLLIVAICCGRRMVLLLWFPTRWTVRKMTTLWSRAAAPSPGPTTGVSP